MKKRRVTNQKAKLVRDHKSDIPHHDRAYECGMCDAVFPTVEDLYRHQQAKHDPDGIMFSELGLPK